MNLREFLSGLRWTVVATAVNFVAQFVFLGILARLLDPAAFGLMAMTAIVLRFASFFAQMGAGQALIQKPELLPRDVGAALALALGVSSLLYVVLWLAAPLAVLYFKSPGLAEMVRWAGLSLIVSAPGGISLACLRRQGRFAALSFAEVFSYIAGYGLVGVACAYQGLGVWSLIAASLAQAALLCLAGFTLARPEMKLDGLRESIGHFWGYGSKHSLIGFLEFIGANLETLYLGRSMGQHALGLYNRAQVLCNLPVEQSVGALGKVVFPLLSRMQHDRHRLGEVFLALLMGIGLIAAPIAFGLSAAAGEVVDILLGPRWADAVAAVELLALSVPALFLYFACGITLDSLAALKAKLALQSLAVIGKLALLFALAGGGLRGAILAVVVAEYLRLGMGLWLCRRELALPWRRVLGAVGFVLLLGLLVHLGVRGGQAVMAEQGLSAWTRLLVEVALAGVIVAAVVLAAARGLPAASPWRDSAVLGRPLARVSRWTGRHRK